jgi:hypothetical protein
MTRTPRQWLSVRNGLEMAESPATVVDAQVTLRCVECFGRRITASGQIKPTWTE